MESDLMTRQLALEEEGVQEGVARYRKLVAESKARGEMTSTTAGNRLLLAAIGPMEKKILDWFETEIKRGKSGRRNETGKIIFQLDADVVAFITAKSVLDSVTKQSTLNTAAINLGGFLEDELRYIHFKGENKGLYSTVKKRITKRSQNYQYKRTVLNHAMGKVSIGWEAWPPTTKLKVGQKCIDLFIEATGLVQATLINRRKNNSIYYLSPTEETMRWINEENARCELLTPIHFPMLLPPKPWQTPYVGGYYSQRVSRTVKLMKSRSKNYMEDLSNRDMPIVYEAINAIQATGWKINQAVLNVVQTIWNSSAEIGKLPARDEMPIPPSPVPKELSTADMTPEQLESLREWKCRAGNAYDANIQNRSKRIQVNKIIYMAEKFADESAIYFPHNMDFRGRIYAVPMFLNPQGNDLAKGVLEFSEGKPVDDAAAGDWIAVHGANLFGYDKVDYAGRVEWVEDHHQQIMDCAADPMEHRWWSTADKPWQFLAFCFEWKRFFDEGLGYISYLPIALDGSCNGLQHYSAMLRDPIGGAAVNLLPSEIPQDIYQVVADVTLKELEVQAAEGNVLAMEWIHFGIDRKLCKRPVMCLPYGLTRHTAREYIAERVQTVLTENPEKFQDGEAFSVKILDATIFLTDIIWNAIAQVVVSAQQAMDWLRTVAVLVSKTGAPVSWQTPTNLPVIQPYQATKANRIHTELAGQLIKLTVKTDMPGIDSKRQANGIAPNFVHSLDSACLQMYVVKAKIDHGIKSFAMVHDSYATHAADTDRSAQVLRDVFVEMYQRDPLKELRDDLLTWLPDDLAAKLPALPETGNMDLELVKNSKFFFS